MIRINKLKLEIDAERFNERFGIIEIIHKDKKYAWKANILDQFSDTSVGVKSTCYRDGAIFVLTDADKAYDIRRIISASDTKGDYISLQIISCKALTAESPNIVAQLLINSLPAVGIDPTIPSVNLTGKMQCHHSAWKGKDDSRKPAYVTLEINVSSDMLLTLDVVTYSTMRKDMKQNGKPMYQIDESGYMRRCFKKGKGQVYIKKGAAAKKNEVPFLCLQDESEFLKTKMGVLNRVLERFAKEYGDMAKLDFECVEPISSPILDGAIKNFKKANKKVSEQWAESHPYIKITDAIGTETSSLIAKQLSVLINGSNEGIDSPAPEIRLIHEADWYKHNKIADPYTAKDLNTNGVQHVTIETISFNGELTKAINTILDNCKNNLIVKEDLKKNKISLLGCELDEDIEFGIVVDGVEKDTKDAITMTVHRDYTTRVKRKRIDPFTTSTDRLYAHICSNWSDEYSGIIRKGDSIMAISDTEMFTLPENELIKKEMRENAGNEAKCKVSRSAEAREKFFTAITDINRFRLDNDIYYNVGILGSGMNTTIQRASRVRKLSLLSGEDFSELILTMLTDAHIRNGQLTVYPVPFKYLHEYEKLCE